MKWQQDNEVKNMRKNMRNVLGLLMIRIAEALDRNLFTVPDLDEDYDPTARRQRATNLDEYSPPRDRVT
jgi:hypothetical protein